MSLVSCLRVELNLDAVAIESLALVIFLSWLPSSFDRSCVKFICWIPGLVRPSWPLSFEPLLFLLALDLDLFDSNFLPLVFSFGSWNFSLDSFGIIWSLEGFKIRQPSMGSLASPLDMVFCRSLIS